jgi:hypothetical protein
MMKKQTGLIVILFCLSMAASAQKTKPAGVLTPENAARIHEIEDTLGILGFVVVNDSIEQERFAACRQLITTLVRALKVENSFRYPFDRLRSISIMAPPDSSFRIFTWQLFVNDSTYRHYGAIQMNQKELKLFALRDKSFEMDNPAPVREVLSPDRWYGSVYYGIREFDTREGKKYLLLGFDAFEFYQRRKVIDVLSFDSKTGAPVFGASVFGKDRPEDRRLIFEYSAEASVRVNWDEQYQLILFDHLIEYPSPFGRGITHVPDGSYDALKQEKGGWSFVEHVFRDDFQETPPFPSPVLDARKEKDIMGRARGKKNK